MAASTRLTAEQRSLRARAGAYALHAQGGTSTAAATAASMKRFEAEVDPDGLLAPDERARRATFARRAYMAKLALRSSIARARARARGQAPPEGQ
jgi:hypothetical protein